MSKWSRLIELLEQKLEIFEEICKLCEKQTGQINADQFGELEGSFGEVQVLREKINGLHQDLDMLMQSYAELPPDERDGRVDELIELNQKTVEKCAQLNNANMSVLQEKTEAQSKKIDEQSAKRKTIGGYAPTITNTTEMFDKKT